MYIYLLILPLVFFYFARKMYYKGNMLAFVILLFYGIGGVMGYFMTQHEAFSSSMNRGYQDPTWEACVYLAVGYMLLIMPIMRSSSTVKIEVNYSSRAINWLSFVLFAVGVIYCIYAAPYIQIALNVSDFVAYKQDILESGGLDISGDNRFLRFLFYLQTIVRPYVTFLFCYVLAKYPTKKLLIFILAVAAILPPIFNSLAAAHRNIVVFLGMELLVGFIIFHKYYVKRIKLIFYIFAGVGFAAMLFIVIFFALKRFTESGASGFEYNLMRYLGEPFVDFNTMLWGTNRLMDGNKCFPVFREWLGMTAMDPWTARFFNAKYVSYFFYGIVGNLYMDFGGSITIVILLAVGIIFNLLINRRKPRNPLIIKMLLFIYAVTTLHNYFYFDFMGGGNLRLLWLIAFFLLFQVILQPVEPNRKKRKKILLDLDEIEKAPNRYTSTSVPPVQGE